MIVTKISHILLDQLLGFHAERDVYGSLAS
jgi:hypothetical protein